MEHSNGLPQTRAQAGDVNNDGRLDLNDLTLLRQLLANPDLYLALTHEQRELLDVNNDGMLSYNDVARLIELMAVSLPVDAPGESVQAMRHSVDALRQRLRERQN
ncbi:MAG: dockerin type I repeat-containing protein [Vampirovibrionales bacterium]|nr:dockerin type I repeat-containing protein [Vampirovibrionales bacterium]